MIECVVKTMSTAPISYVSLPENSTLKGPVLRGHLKSPQFLHHCTQLQVLQQWEFLLIERWRQICKMQQRLYWDQKELQSAARGGQTSNSILMPDNVCIVSYRKSLWSVLNITQLLNSIEIIFFLICDTIQGKLRSVARIVNADHSCLTVCIKHELSGALIISTAKRCS